MSDDPDDRSEDEIIVHEGQTRFDRCVKYESLARSRQRLDKLFANADAYNLAQWDTGIVTSRGDRPCLTNNKVRQLLLQINNDQRRHKTQIKVSPSGGHATYEAAQIYSACIRRIESQSKAVDAYSTAGFDQVETGRGYCRVVTRYENEESFNQEIYILRESEPTSIYIDPDAKDYDKADMRFAFKFRDMPRDEFRTEYGEEAECSSAPLNNRDSWDSKDHVRVCEYFRRTDKQDSLHLMDDGTVMRESEQPDDWKEKNEHKISRTRAVAKTAVEWFLIAGHKIIDRKPWPGKYIPIVPWIGEEYVIDGQMDCRGHVRALLDPQRIYNYATSAAVEFVALQTKTPYIASAEAIEGHEDDWENANVQNKAYLLYNQFDENGVREYARPEREKPPAAASAYLELMNNAKFEMMMVSGQYQENLGQQSNAQSGVAINARQREGDNATYHYIDNHAKAVRQIGRIIMDMIPRVYDVSRVIKIMAMDGTMSDVHVDPEAQEAHQHVMDGPQGPTTVNADQARQADNDPGSPDVRVIFNPSIGEYDLDVDVGAPFATQREEAANALTQIIQANPSIAPWTLDVLALNWDWPGADVIAERAKRMVPPEAVGGPSPEMKQMQAQMQQHSAAAQQSQQAAQGEITRLQGALQDAQRRLKDQAQDQETAEFKAATDRFAVVAKADPMMAQMLIRQMAETMHQADVVPLLAHHATVEAGLGAVGQPPAVSAPTLPMGNGQPTLADPGATNGPGPQP